MQVGDIGRRRAELQHFNWRGGPASRDYASSACVLCVGRVGVGGRVDETQ